MALESYSQTHGRSHQRHSYFKLLKGSESIPQLLIVKRFFKEAVKQNKK